MSWVNIVILATAIALVMFCHWSERNWESRFRALKNYAMGLEKGAATLRAELKEVAETRDYWRRRCRDAEAAAHGLVGVKE